jgi:hypothetical protein
MPTRDRTVFILDPFGTFREIKVLGLQGEYGRKAET